MISDPIVFSSGNIIFVDPKEFDDGLLVISNESVDFNDQRNSMIFMYSMIQREFQSEVWTLINQKSTVTPPSSMILFLKRRNVPLSSSSSSSNLCPDQCH